MKSGGWIPISKGAVKYLPKDRPYTELEAMLCIQIDYDGDKSATVAGYTDLWQWSRDRVYRFLKKIGIKIIYSQDTAQFRNQRGIITPTQPGDKKWRFVDNKQDIKQDINPTYKNQENQDDTKTKKHKPDIKQDTTIDTKKLNTTNSSKNAPYVAIFDLFRECLPELPRPRKITANRKRLLNARWNGGFKSESTGLKSNSAEFWQGFFQYIRQSDFLMGRNGKWQATFDWIIKESNFVKIQEGNYHK